MTEWKILIPAKVTENGSFDASNLLTIEQFNSFKNSDLKDIKKEIKDLKDRPTTSVDTSDFVTNTNFENYTSTVNSLSNRVESLEGRSIPDVSEFATNSKLNDCKRRVENVESLANQIDSRVYTLENAGSIDTSKFVLKNDFNNFKNKAEEDYASKEDLSRYVWKSALNDYVTKEDFRKNSFNAGRYYDKQDIDQKFYTLNLFLEKLVPTFTFGDYTTHDFQISYSASKTLDFTFKSDDKAIIDKQTLDRLVVPTYYLRLKKVKLTVDGMEFISPYGADGDLLPLEYTHSTSTKTDYDEYAYYYLSNNENNKHIVFGLKLRMTLQLKPDKSGFTLEVIPTDFEKGKVMDGNGPRGNWYETFSRVSNSDLYDIVYDVSALSVTPSFKDNATIIRNLLLK